MTKIILLLLIFSLAGCAEKGGSILHDTPSEKDIVIGKYHVIDFRTESFTLLKSKPERKFAQPLLELDFQPSGKIKATDLTDVYECGNGTLSLTECEWRNIGKNKYKLRFVGEYALDSKFETIGNYDLVIEGDNKSLILTEMVFNEVTRFETEHSPQQN